MGVRVRDRFSVRVRVTTALARFAISECSFRHETGRRIKQRIHLTSLNIVPVNNDMVVS